MQKKPYDNELLRKCFRAANMTDPEISRLFDIPLTAIRRVRNAMGYARPERIKCNVCGELCAPNTFKSTQPGVCIKCRREMGIEERSWAGGRPSGKRAVTRKCLKCDKEFQSPLGYNNKPIQHICNKCTFTNHFLGNEEGYGAQNNMRRFA